jgi:uncharacterized membrane protein
MAAITWEDVAALSTSLSTLSEEMQAAILDHVNTTLVVEEFGGEEAAKLKLARIYLAAHHGTIAERSDGKVGPVVSESAGPLSRSYSNGSSTNDGYDATSYGRAYSALLRTTPARAPVAI